jgi:hypothetical protein
MTLTFSDGTNTYSIATYGGILSAVRYTPPQPIQQFVDVPGRSTPIDISRTATGYIGFGSAVYEYDVAIVGYDNIAQNDAQASNLASYLNGNYLAVSDALSNSYNGEVSITSYTFLGEYVIMTIRVVVV